MRAILAVMKKELKSILLNKTILAQIILIPFCYLFGFTYMTTMMVPEETIPENTVLGYYANLDGDLAATLDALGLEQCSIEDIETHKEEIAQENTNILVVFPDDFLQKSTELLPDVEMWYNSYSEDSYEAYLIVNSVLESLNPKLFTINADTETTYDLMDESKVLKEMLAMVFPMYTLVSILVTSQALAAESIAGDKERGFLNMMLLAPVKRYSIAIGKTLSLLVVNTISTMSAFVAVVLSLGKFGESMGLASNVVYGMLDYINYFVLTISATTVLMSFMLLISTLANSTKQANTMNGLMMIVILLISLLSGSGFDMTKNISTLGLVNSYIPVWNSVVNLQAVFTQTLVDNSVLLTVIVNLVTTMIILSVVAKLFTSEKIVNNVSN